MYFFGFLRALLLINLVIALLGFYGFKTFIKAWLGVFGVFVLLGMFLFWLTYQQPQVSNDINYTKYAACSDLVYNKSQFPTITKCMASAGAKDWIK